MTTPSERARAIRWGRDDLLKIQNDSQVTDEIKQTAAEIYKGYPDEALLQSWIDSRSFIMSKEAASTLDTARRLFEDIRMADQFNGTPELRQSLLYTLRHFPLPSDLNFKQQAGTDLIFGRLWVE